MQFPNYPDSVYVVKYKLMDDLGRAAVTKDPADKNMWRVPALLNKTLPDAQVDDIVAFLLALSGPFPQQECRGCRRPRVTCSNSVNVVRRRSKPVRPWRRTRSVWR